MAKKYFGTDGIRGAINSKNINGDMFFKFGLASGTYFKSQKKKKQTAIIAKDTRLSGYTLEPALVSGLASAGMHVYTLGPLPTNGLAMLTKEMKANMGIMITASHNPHYDNGLKLFGPDGMKLSDKIEKKIESLIDKKIIIDPGIGFGKNLKHNLTLISKISLFHSLGFPILIGTSRKRFINQIVGTYDSKDRIGGTVASVLFLLSQGVQIFRVHNVNEVKQSILVFRKILSNFTN